MNNIESLEKKIKIKFKDKKHIEEARKRNIPYEIHKLPRVALDIDEPEDLSLFASQKSETITYGELIRIGFIRGL